MESKFFDTEKKEFFDALNQIRTQNGNYTLVNKVARSVDDVLGAYFSRFPYNMEKIIFNDLAMNMDFYSRQDSPDRARIVERLLYTMKKTVDFENHFDLAEEFVIILEALSYIDHGYDRNEVGSLLKFILENMDEYERRKVVKRPRIYYKKTKTRLFSEYNWLKGYLASN